MRIIAGRYRGRQLVAPRGVETRPTADRARQALFDMLMHAPWAEGAMRDAAVLDVFAGTGALGLEALSRGAASAVFVENGRAALAALRANVAGVGVEDVCRVVVADARVPPPGVGAGVPAGLVFLDPPYGQGLVPVALAALERAGWLAVGALVVAEVASAEALGVETPLLVERAFGAARVCVWRRG